MANDFAAGNYGFILSAYPFNIRLVLLLIPAMKIERCGSRYLLVFWPTALRRSHKLYPGGRICR